MIYRSKLFGIAQLAILFSPALPTPSFAGNSADIPRAFAPRQANPCEGDPERRKFDFWIGEWNVKTAQGQAAGRSSIQAILGRCVIFENWTGARGYDGKSFNFYDPAVKKWRQTWVDNRGGVLEFVGAFQPDGALHYTGESRDPQGQKILHRLTFFNLAPDRVRQLWEQSSDSGTTWKTVFDGHYHRRK